MSEEVSQTEEPQGLGSEGVGDESVLFGNEGAANQTGQDGQEVQGAQKATDGKAQDGKTPSDDKAGGQDDADKVPEDGNYTLTMPEGVPLDEELFKALSPSFKEIGLTQGQAQKLVDGYIKAETARMGSQSEAFGEIQESWVKEAKNDKEIGGDKWDETLMHAKRAVGQFSTPALLDYLNVSGAGNHPEMIRLMAKVGAMIGEDNPAQGGAGEAAKPTDAAYILFPKDVKK